jgi:enoyl-CoA hydratase
MPNYETILVENEAEIATLLINRPQKANILSRQTLAEMGQAIKEIAANETIRAVIITGAGERSFISGADIREMAELTPASARFFIRQLHTTLEAIRQLEKPVIAAVNGVCLGAGLELAVSCDFILAAENASFGMPEIELGIPSVIEAALLLNLLGALRTKEFLMTGDRWDASRAERYGLVNQIVPANQLIPSARAVCQSINRHSSLAVALQKDLVNRWLSTDLDSAIEYGINAFGIAFTSGDPQKAMGSFVNKRTANLNPDKETGISQ